MIDIDHLSEDQIKSLYAPMKLLQKNSKLPWNDFLYSIYHSPQLYSPSDQSGLSKGRLSQAKAADIYRYIAEHHLHIGKTYAADLFDHAQRETTWQTFIEAHGLFDAVHIRRLRGLSLTTRAKPRPHDPTPVPVNTPFCFMIDSTVAGDMIALQKDEDEWVLLSLDADVSAPFTPCLKGMHAYPHDRDTREPIALEDSADELRPYVFIIGDPSLIAAMIKDVPIGFAIKSERLKHMAELYEDAGSKKIIYRHYVRFVR